MPGGGTQQPLARVHRPHDAKGFVLSMIMVVHGLAITVPDRPLVRSQEPATIIHGAGWVVQGFKKITFVETGSPGCVRTVRKSRTCLEHVRPARSKRCGSCVVAVEIYGSRLNAAFRQGPTRISMAPRSPSPLRGASITPKGRGCRLLSPREPADANTSGTENNPSAVFPRKIAPI